MATFDVGDGIGLTMKELVEVNKRFPGHIEFLIEDGTNELYMEIYNRCPVDSGDLKKSIKRTIKRSKKTGTIYGRVEFKGYKKSEASKRHPKGKPYSLVAAVNEYGSPKQSAKPFIKPAVNKIGNELIETFRLMHNQFLEEIAKEYEK